MHILCTADGEEGYTLHVHTLHVHTADGLDGCPLHVKLQIARGVDGCTLHFHIDGGVDGCPLHVHTAGYGEAYYTLLYTMLVV